MQSLCLKPPNISPPAETIASNQDLLTPVLLCIPARSLLRFKCVCKNWFVLISNPKFCDIHTSKNPYPNVSAFFFHTAIHDFYFISIPNNENQSGSLLKPPRIIEHPPRIKILQSCNGLLLCCSLQEITNTSSTPRCYFVLNPTTNKFSAITNSPYATKSTSILGVALAFDPSKSLHYKVLCIRCIAGSVISFQIEIYSSETRNWTLRESTFLRPFHIDFSHGVYFNGAINWISRTSRVLHYNIDEESHGMVSRPPSYNVFRKREYRYFGESRGHLHLIEIYRPCVTQFDVMEMERDYSGWFVKYHVDLDPIAAAFPEMVPEHNIFDPSKEETWYYHYAFVVLFLAREVNKEGSSLLLHIPCKVISYNLRDKSFEKACELTSKGTESKRSLQVGWRDAYHYMETLACV